MVTEGDKRGGANSLFGLYFYIYLFNYLLFANMFVLFDKLKLIYFYTHVI